MFRLVRQRLNLQAAYSGPTGDPPVRVQSVCELAGKTQHPKNQPTHVQPTSRHTCGLPANLQLAPLAGGAPQLWDLFGSTFAIPPAAEVCECKPQDRISVMIVNGWARYGEIKCRLSDCVPARRAPAQLRGVFGVMNYAELQTTGNASGDRRRDRRHDRRQRPWRQ